MREAVGSPGSLAERFGDKTRDVCLNAPHRRSDLLGLRLRLGRSSEGYLAVIVDDRCTSMHAHPDEPRLVILGHPLESMILEELGFTFTSAGLGGRLVYGHAPLQPSAPRPAIGLPESFNGL